MIHSPQDLKRLMTRLWQVAGKPRSSSCQKIGCLPSRIMRIFAFRHPWTLSTCAARMSYRLEKQKAAFLASASFYNPRIAELDALVQRTTLKHVCEIGDLARVPAEFGAALRDAWQRLRVAHPAILCYGKSA